MCSCKMIEIINKMKILIDNWSMKCIFVFEEFVNF